MELRCKPGQMAWIDVPRTRSNEALGITQLQGHVVRVQRLLLPQPRPTWAVDPPQRCVIVGPVPSGCGLKPGDKVACVGIPDSFLRPFEDFPPHELEDLVEELQHAIGCRE